MIRITRHSPACVSVKGHANSDVYGKDLVCAAVSALVLTLAANVEKMKGAEMVLEPGNCRIQCGSEADAVFDCICKGFEMLAGKYPGYVCYLESTRLSQPV